MQLKTMYFHELHGRLLGLSVDVVKDPHVQRFKNITCLNLDAGGRCDLQQRPECLCQIQPLATHHADLSGAQRSSLVWLFFGANASYGFQIGQS